MTLLKTVISLVLLVFTVGTYADGLGLSDAQINKLFGTAELPAQQESTPKVKKPSINEIKEVLIKQSHSRYSGNCPCPYSRASNGSRCGKRSAWSKPGGYEPLCYESDVTEEMIKRYKDRRK